jgi:organic radical activating enzyme
MFLNKFNNDLNKFKKIFLKEDKILFYGASKDFVLLIETLDHILKKKININFIIDDFIEGVFENLYDVNLLSYKPDKFLQPNTRTINVLNSKLFFKNSAENKKYKIIVVSDAKKNSYFKNLKELGYKYYEDFFDYKEFGAFYPLIKENKTHIWRADIMLTEKCTLNCTFCNMYMPHYKNPKHKNFVKFKIDIDLFFATVDFVSLFHLVGGEPLMNPEIEKIIEYIGTKYRKKIGKLLITTNGTLTPNDKVIQLIKKFHLLVSVSDYTNEVSYKRRFDLLINILKKNSIPYFIRKDIFWTDFGHPEEIKFNDIEVVDHFKKCTAPYKGINDGKYYFCHLNTSAVQAKLIKDDENDYYPLKKRDKLGLLAHDLGYLTKGYSTFCKNCNGCNTGIEIKVKAGVQGLRKF